ncbi:uncharacterized protein CPUR_00916 [Claviceps purpurea 20.1]|uniref:Kinetochore protein mis14 n=1 Tax=Claviceps purpurea (strain 20.1) TaxID=1111077 RepID=M1VUA7_CLAP2|nr:uncharacterized protein CPUR_00916 [Claviceps purpurea 20.1]
MDPDSQASQNQRRIELQSPEDLAYLISNVRKAATAHLEEALPRIEGQREDRLREDIAALVNQYETFTTCTPQAYEPFDGRTRQRVADLITQEEKLLEEVAALKRSVPAQAAAEHAARIEAAIRRDEELVQRRREEVGRRAEEQSEGVLVLGNEKGSRQEGMEEGFRGAVEGLGMLKRDMPAVVARMERARVAGEYVAEGR